MDFSAAAAAAASLLPLSLWLCWLVSSEATNTCSSSPCQNGGICEVLEGGYKCICPENPPIYVGRNCEFLYDACSGHPCPPDWICTSITGHLTYTCRCGLDLITHGCSIDVDHCESSPCLQPHLECIEMAGGYGCQCQSGDNNCRPEAASLCSSYPCHNNGTCMGSAGEYVCQCQPGYEGHHCEEDVDECASGPCQNGAICLDRVNGYSCFCVPGFQGHHCEMDINECASRPCQHNGTCLNQMDHYVCQCLPGYTGVNCDVEIDECESNPCGNGATCRDFIGFFTCSCVPGFVGIRCEREIDECQSQPCLHGGICHDFINSYQCDCHNTGFEGQYCELDILECASQPCQNGATCLEDVGCYSCACWPGYTGEHCEEDVDECATEPCLNGGRCYERSNQSYYGQHVDFPTQFSYRQAAGFVCECQTGFDGEICSIDIDECASQPCQNGGACVDLVNSYQCRCLPGYSGMTCATDINECEDLPCENWGTCEDSIADYICHCLPGQDGVAWGGKNCSVELTGCQTHNCQNEALCIPTYQSETHGYLCQCRPGFYGSTCSLPTTFSFTSSAPLFIHMSANNESSSDAWGPVRMALRFRTTLPNGVLFYRGNKAEYLFLELLDGLLHVTLMVQNATFSLTVEAPRVNDGQWHNAEVLLQDCLELKLWHDACDAGLCLRSCHLGEVPSNSFLPSFLDVYMGGTQEGLVATRNFIGCLEDLYVDSKVVLPQEVIGGQPLGIQMGCERREWCQSQPCSRSGLCIDLWTDFRCDCFRPYTGRTCNYELPAGTFGLDNSSSFASFAVSNCSGANFNLSFFFRTLKPSGLLFYIGDGNETFLTVYLQNGQLQLQAQSAAPVNLSGHLADGKRNFVMLSSHEGIAYASILNREEELRLGPLMVTPLRMGCEIHVGGLADQEDVGIWGGHFKGCLQDVQLNHHQLQLFPQQLNNNMSQEVYVGQTTNVALGCISDDACKSGPCLNGGHCVVTWNDFQCNCSSNFTGKSCEERVWCKSEPCPQAATCVDVPSGYVCLSSATFYDHNAVKFTTNANITRALGSLRLDFRTRDEDATLLKAVQEVDSLLVAVHNSSLLVEIRSGNGVEGVNFLSQMSVSDGSWHTLVLSMEEPSALSSRWRLHLDGSVNITLHGQAGNLDFLKHNAVLVLAENFTGCLGHADIGGVFLPLSTHPSYPQPEQFMLMSSGEIVLGCKGEDVCASSPCHHLGTCQDRFNAFSCSCSAGWQGPLCESNIDDCSSSPCVHGVCVDEVANFHCVCDKGYTGKQCQINVDDCILHRCQNGGICVDGVYSYSCNCLPQFTGPHCEWQFAPEQCSENFTCLNGGKCISRPWGTNCTCKPGYAGRRCQININDCDPNPCQNGGTCQEDLVSRYLCVCSASYTGEHCDIERGIPGAFFQFPLIEVAVPVACGCFLLLIIILILMILTARKRRQSEGTYSPSQQEVAGARLEMDSVLKRSIWAHFTSSSLIGAVGAAGAAILLTIFGVSVIGMKKRRATHGTYSPSRQEKAGARLEMWNVIKLPPMERLI